MTDWSQYPNFSESEFRCKQTDECVMDDDFLARLQALRTELGIPFIISSGYRSPQHKIERAKAAPGPHAHGKAVDILCDGPTAYKIMQAAFRMGFTGIGVSQNPRGARFVHLDTMPRTSVWSY